MILLKISFDGEGDFEKAIKWLEDTAKMKLPSVSNTIAKDGIKALSKATPRDTGVTASGWVSEVKMTAKGSEIVWKNTARPHLSVNLALLIELGHGTRNGGYIPPRPYIKQAMDSVFKTAGDNIAGELFK